MKVLVLGFSNIAQRRVLPALRNIEEIGRIDIATRKVPDVGAGKIGTVFHDYDEALRSKIADVVYISLINSAHETWAEKALNLGYHVIVDKPAFTGLQVAQNLAALAEKQGLCLAEAVVFGFHPQIAAIRKVFEESGSELTRITAAFSFPPLSPQDFRNSREAGGGSLWDLGPYAIAIGREFFGGTPDDVVGRILSRDRASGVDRAFSVLLTYPGGRSVVGQFGFDTEYRNCANIFGPGVSVEVDRLFTTTPDFKNHIRVKRRNVATELEAQAADSFELFIRHVLGCINGNGCPRLSQRMLQDAIVMNRLRQSCGEN